MVGGIWRVAPAWMCARRWRTGRAACVQIARCRGGAAARGVGVVKVVSAGRDGSGASGLGGARADRAVRWRAAVLAMAHFFEDEAEGDGSGHDDDKCYDGD